MKRLMFLLICNFLFIVPIFAQEVSILIPRGNRAFEAMAWAEDGRIITCDFISGWVFGIRRDGGLDTLVRNRLGPLGGTFDPEGNYYYSEFGTGSLRRYGPDGRDSVLATDLGQPTGTYYDEPTGRVLVADYTFNRLHAYSLTTGSVEVLIDSTFASGLNGPDGIAPAPGGGYLVANFNDSLIHRVDTNGDVSQFSFLPGSSQSGYLIPYLDGYLSAGLTDNRIWFITPTGEASVWAGTGMQAFINGNRLDTVAFSIPNGLALSPDKDSLVISENTRIGQIRLITGLNDLTVVTGREVKDFGEIKVYPFPAEGSFVTSFLLENREEITANLLAADGKIIVRYSARQLLPGPQEERWAVPDTVRSGIYFLQIRSDSGRHSTQKVMLKR